MTESTRTLRGRAAHARGRSAEVLCLMRLWLTGWRVISHRLLSKRGTGLGEIDIVAKRGRVLAFIEVKARMSTGDALESINSSQRSRIERAAAAFLAYRAEYAACDIRFDAMVVAGRLWPTHVTDAWRAS